MIGLLISAAAAAATTPPSCDRPGWDRLSVLTGEWTVTISFRTAPGHFEAGTLDSHVRQGSAPCTLVDDMRGTLAGKPVAFMSLLTITPSGSVERSYLDSEHGRILHYSGALDGKLARLTMDFPADARFASRAEIDVSDRTKPRITHLLSTDSGQTWQTVLTFRYSPKSKPG